MKLASAMLWPDMCRHKLEYNRTQLSWFQGHRSKGVFPNQRGRLTTHWLLRKELNLPHLQPARKQYSKRWLWTKQPFHETSSGTITNERPSFEAAQNCRYLGGWLIYHCELRGFKESLVLETLPPKPEWTQTGQYWLVQHTLQVRGAGKRLDFCVHTHGR